MDQAINLAVGYDDQAVTSGVQRTKARLSELERGIASTAKSWLAFGAGVGAAATALDAMRDSMADTLRSGGGLDALALSFGDNIAAALASTPVAGAIGEMMARGVGKAFGGTGLTDAEQQAKRSDDVARTQAIGKAIESLKMSLDGPSLSPRERLRQATDERVGGVLRMIREQDEIEEQKARDRIELLRDGAKGLRSRTPSAEVGESTGIGTAGAMHRSGITREDLRRRNNEADAMDAAAESIERDLRESRSRFAAQRTELQDLQRKSAERAAIEEEAPRRAALVESQRRTDELVSKLQEETMRRNGDAIGAETERIRREYDSRVRIVNESAFKLMAASEAPLRAEIERQAERETGALNALRDRELLTLSQGRIGPPQAVPVQDARFLSLRRDNPSVGGGVQERIAEAAKQQLLTGKSAERLLGEIFQLLNNPNGIVVGGIR